jgi:hypothetical protein
MIEKEYENASDETRLQGIKNEMKEFVKMMKMSISTSATIEAHRQLITGELPDHFKEFVSSDEFQQILVAGIKANNEIVRNLMTFMIRVGDIIGVDYESMMPKTQEEFHEMSNKLRAEIEKDAEEEFLKGEW